MKNRFVYEVVIQCKDDEDDFCLKIFRSSRSAEEFYNFLLMVPGFTDHYVVVIRGYIVSEGVKGVSD